MTERNKPTRDDKDSERAGVDSNQLSEMEAQIDQTRSAISGDLRTLSERLSPENLKENAKEVVSEAKSAAFETLHEARDAATHALRDAKDSAVETVSAKVHELRDDVRRAERETLGFLRENAVPLTLIGIGVGWFFMQRRAREREWDREYPWGAAGDAARDYRMDWRSEAADDARYRVSRGKQQARHMAQRAGDRAQRWVEDAEHVASETTHRVRDFAEREMDEARSMARGAERKLGETASRARDFAGRELRHARDFSVRTSETHPFAVGAAALAAGIGVGLALPKTQREAELLGPQRDRIARGAKEIVDDWSHTASETARNVKESITGSRPRAPGAERT